jgi:hypothetical protein
LDCNSQVLFVEAMNDAVEDRAPERQLDAMQAPNFRGVHDCFNARAVDAVVARMTLPVKFEETFVARLLGNDRRSMPRFPVLNSSYAVTQPAFYRELRANRVYKKGTCPRRTKRAGISTCSLLLAGVASTRVPFIQHKTGSRIVVLEDSGLNCYCSLLGVCIAPTCCRGLRPRIARNGIFLSRSVRRHRERHRARLNTMWEGRDNGYNQEVLVKFLL